MLNLEKKLDRAYQETSKGGRCYYCGTTENLCRHHLIRRANKLYRWDLLNSIVVCRNCHTGSRSIHGGQLKEPKSDFRPNTLKKQLLEWGITYNEFLKIRASAFDVKYTESDFKKPVRVKQSRTQKAINPNSGEYKEAMRKKAKEIRHENYLKQKEFIKNSKKK